MWRPSFFSRYNCAVTTAPAQPRRHAEIAAGLTTFLAMAYILVVQPVILSGLALGENTGLAEPAIFTVTCLAAALGCLLMAVVARLPIAAAPGVGLNFFMVGLVTVAAQHLEDQGRAGSRMAAWSAAQGCVFAAAVLLVIVSATGMRRALADAVDLSLQKATCAGIGLFIALIGLKNAGVVAVSEGTGLALTDRIASPDSLVLLIGLAVGAGLIARGRMSGIGLSMVAGWGAAFLLHAGAAWLPVAWTQSLAWSHSALAYGLQMPDRVLAMPPSPGGMVLGLDPWAALNPALIGPTIALLLASLFDATGSIIAVTARTGLVENTSAPAFKRALLADSLGSLGGSLLGSSPVTAYVESATGITAGGRTGLTALVVAVCFVGALFAWPLLNVLAAYPPATAAALLIVGALMMEAVLQIEWRDTARSLPALLVLVGIPATSSIATGLALGLVAGPLVMLVAGRGREVRPLSWLLVLLMAAYLAWDGTH